ncbi:MAG: hypothetical protein WBJ10_06885 [Daejeonella sp.]|uniref:hypothetical protein n=1 Tax=Daejeonella sp. TaxID=2805397 RepID=UPI003C790739
MKKNLLKSLLCLFAIAAVAPDYAAYGQEKKAISRSIIINNGDTTVNGKKFSDLNKDERAKLREEFREMEKNFNRGSTIRSSSDRVIIRKDGGDKKEIVITRDGQAPGVLHWNDDIGAEVRTYNFKSKKPGDLKVFRYNGDSLITDKDIRVFDFDGDSSQSFKFNMDSLMQRFELNGLDSNLRKRVITMHREMMPGRPVAMVFRGNGPGFDIERRAFAGPLERNNSSSFNYNHTDKDGISSRVNIRMSDAGKDQLKKITGSETIAKTLDVDDLTLFPNFSSGKMTLSFNLASKGSTIINVLDSEMNFIFKDETANFSGNYVRQFTLPKNGLYYVTVNQNGNWFVKRIVKE